MLSGASAASAVEAAPDAYAVFQRVHSAISSAAYPRRLDYTIVVSGLDGDRFCENHYHASIDPGDGKLREMPMSDEELAAPPPHPHGFNFKIQGNAISIGGATPPPDILGVPLVSPTYDFGLAYPQLAQAVDGSYAAALRTIAVVSTKTRDYDVALVDEPVIDDEPTYNLKLTPLRQPRVHRLRELWVGARDYLPRKALIAGNFMLAPLEDIPWTITFALFHGAPVIANESAEGPLYLPHRRVVRDATIAFENVHEPSGSPIGEPLVSPQLDGLTTTTLVEPR